MKQLEKTKELHNQGQFQEAIAGYQELLKTDPNNDDIHFGLAHAYSRTNQAELALKHAKEAVNLSPHSDRYLQFKAQMQLANNQIDDALKTFKKSINENPNLFFSYLAIGDIYAIKNESTKAKKNYELALKVHQNGIPATIKLSKLLILEGNYQEAADILQQAELQFPDDPELKLHIGIMRLEQGEDAFAELYFKKLIENEPNHVLAKVYLAISLINNDPEQATQIINELISQEVQLPELMAALGLLCAKKNLLQDAIKYLTPICQSGLVYPSWLLALAHALSRNKQPQAAMAVLQEILKRGNNPKALLALADIHMANKQYSEALKALKRINKTARESNHVTIKQAECHYLLGDYKTAIERIDVLLADINNHPLGIKLKLNALSKLSQYDTALKLIDSIDTSKQSNDFKQLIHFYSGLFFDQQQQYQSAWQHFNALEHNNNERIEPLDDTKEKTVQKFPTSQADDSYRFVFTDPATGHHDFVNWLLKNEFTPLTDRLGKQGRSDVFSQQWTVSMLEDLTETQTHLWRKKYRKYIQQMVTSTQTVDFMPFSPMNVAVIKRIFPQARVLILSRNFADLRLHNMIFGQFQIHYATFSKLTNQMIALNPNVQLVDIDAWQNKDPNTIDVINTYFGSSCQPFSLADNKPLDRMIFPYMHWKNYQQQLSE